MKPVRLVGGDNDGQMVQAYVNSEGAYDTPIPVDGQAKYIFDRFGSDGIAEAVPWGQLEDVRATRRKVAQAEAAAEQQPGSETPIE